MWLVDKYPKIHHIQTKTMPINIVIIQLSATTLLAQMIFYFFRYNSISLTFCNHEPKHHTKGESTY